jgi:hypothetical protein
MVGLDKLTIALSNKGISPLCETVVAKTARNQTLSWARQIHFTHHTWLIIVELVLTFVYVLVPRLVSYLLVFRLQLCVQISVSFICLKTWPFFLFEQPTIFASRSQWPHGLRRRSAAARLLTEIVDLNPTRGIKVYLLWVLCVVR